MMIIDIVGQVRWILQGVSYIDSKCRELWFTTNGLKLDRSFYPPSVNSAFYFIARLRRQRSAKGTQPTSPNGEQQIALTICRREVGIVTPKKLGPKTSETSWRMSSE